MPACDFLMISLNAVYPPQKLTANSLASSGFTNYYQLQDCMFLRQHNIATRNPYFNSSPNNRFSELEILLIKGQRNNVVKKRTQR
jgi:hypothetical protein